MKLQSSYEIKRRRTGAMALAAVVSLAVTVVWVAWRNWRFVDAGMLKPDFGLVHRAYHFNLVQLPQVLLALAVAFAVAGLVRWNWRRGAWIAAFFYCLLAAAGAGLRHYVTRVEPERLVLREVTLHSAKVAQPLRILHLSDIQAGEIGPYQIRIFERIRELDPDLVLNTGDYLQVVPPATFDSEISKLTALYRTLDPPYGCFGVFGDTDYIGLPTLPVGQLEPLKLLSSRHATIETAAGPVSLLGLSLYQSRHPEWNRRTIERWLEESGGAPFRILMGHAPEFAANAGDYGVDLCLAGHTHGGQVRLPLIGALVIDSDVPKEWASGFREVDGSHLNVSAGAGSNRYGGLPPLRFNCPTEMTLITVLPESRAESLL